MQTDTDIEKLAHEMADHILAQRKAEELVAKKEFTERYGLCPCCKMGYRRDTPVEGVQRCNECRSYFGEKYTFQFPAWARGKRQFFRRALCLALRIQHKES